MMPLLDGFRPFNFNEGVPYVSVTVNGMTFNKSVVMKLAYPTHVVLLIDEVSKRIAIKKCDETAQNAVAFYKPKKTKVISVRWNGRDLLNTIEEMMGWDLSKMGYKADGFLLREEEAMVFDLSKAIELK